MKAITDRLEWLEHYVRNSASTDKEIAWSLIQEIRAIAEALPARVTGPGCVCPPASEKTCQAPLCERRGLAGRGSIRDANRQCGPIIKLPPT